MSTSTTPATSSSSSSPEATSSKKIPTWLPISAFIGTTLAVAIPLIMVRRQRRAGLHIALNSAPPPRVSRTSPSLPHRPASSQPATPRAPDNQQHESEFSSPGVGELISAVSKADLNASLMAFKAFGIATCLVVVGGVSATWGVKSAMGVNDAREFGAKMRMTFWSVLLDNLLSRIYRPPATDEEWHDAFDTAPFEADKDWTWVEAEKRLGRAYEEGGFPLWARTAMREVEAEARVERVRREREMEEKGGRGGVS